MDTFLVQVNRDGGYTNIMNNRRYENPVWMNKPRDSHQGEVNSGDQLLIYCSQNVPSHDMSLAFSVNVREVSSDNVTLHLNEPQYFEFPIKFHEIRARIDRGALPDVFRKCGQQGFNIAKLDPSAAQQILHLVQPGQSDESLADPWGDFVKLAQAFIDTGQLESQEIEYKVEIAHKLEAAKEAVLNGTDDWGELLGIALAPRQGHPMDWRAASSFKRWCSGYPDDALRALQVIWSPDTSPVSQRIRAFSDMLPSSMIRGTGTRMRAISVLLMGLDLQKYPPYMWTPFAVAYRYTGYDEVGWNRNEEGQYEHAMGFLDRFIDEAAERGLTLRHRLDAQSVVWAIHEQLLSTEDGPPSPPPPPPPEDPLSKENVDKLARELMWEPSDVQSIINGLKDKGQVIFQGPPGTGKTFVAKRFGEWAKEHGGCYKIVQFHPSYSYEDFVEGYRPKLAGKGNDKLVFEPVDGPLKEIAKKAGDKPDATFILVIDEINRTNVSKVLGELYFLLEYREDNAPLLYSKEDFNLPKNLWIIGTMNTTDRTIALVDAALRRRFYFYDFFPNQPPVKGLLRRWLKENDPDMMKVADLLDYANKELEDRHLSIGPSHFMKKEKLSEDKVRFIWERAVYPYIEERLFGEEGKLEKFTYEALKQGVGGSTLAPSDEGMAQEPQGPGTTLSNDE